MSDDWAAPLQDAPSAAAAPATPAAPADPAWAHPLQDAPHAGMSHNAPAQIDHPGAPWQERFVGGVQSGVLEANKLAAQFGLWIGHPHDQEDLNEAIRLQNEHEAKVKAEAPTGVDAAHIAGEALNPLNFVPGPARAIEFGGTAGNALRGAVQGMQGAITAPSKGADNMRQKGGQLLSGAAGGAVLGSAIPEMGPEAKKLVDEGIRLTPGMKVSWLRRPEEAARSLPITGQFIGSAERTARDDFNRAIYNRVLKPVGEKYDPKAPVGYDGIAQLRDKISQKYDAALNGTTFIANPPAQIPHGLQQGDLHDLNNIMALMTQERRQQFDQIINHFYTQRVPANRLMDGDTFKRVESELSAQARRFHRSDDPDQRAVGEAVDETVSLLRDAHAVQNPSKAAELQAANRAYRLYTIAERGAGGRPKSNGVMTPSDFLAALKAMDSSVRKNRFARGKLEMQDLATAGNTVMTPHLGSSGTAERSFTVDAAELIAGSTGAHYFGVPSADIGAFIAGLAAAGVPYWRRGVQGATANLGSRVGAKIAPVVQGAAPAAGNVAAQGLGGQP